MSVVVQELEFAINRALYCLLWSLGNQYNVGSLLAFFATYSKLNGWMVGMTINHRPLFNQGLQFIGLSQLAFYVNLHRAVIGPSATLTGRWRSDIDLRRMLTGLYHQVLA